MSTTAYDPIAPWFEAAEALGEFIGIRFGQIRPGQTEPEWTFLRHADFDGIGGLADILRKRGVTTLEKLPQMKHAIEPSWGPFLKMSPKFLKPRQRLKLAPVEQNGAPPATAQPPSAVAWHVFDAAATVELRKAAKREGVTVNTFLLKYLTLAIRPFLQDKSAAVPWMIPVNVRGKVTRGRDTANHTSYISVKVGVNEAAQNIHKDVYAALDRGDHWANWYAYDLGRFNNKGVKKFLLKHELATAEWNLGCLSNLGEWDPEKKITEPSCLGDWLFCPPVLRFQKIAAGCMTFQNRLSLLIQAHAELTTSVAVPRAWMGNWVGGIEQVMKGS